MSHVTNVPTHMSPTLPRCGSVENERDSLSNRKKIAHRPRQNLSHFAYSTHYSCYSHYTATLATPSTVSGLHSNLSGLPTKGGEMLKYGTQGSGKATWGAPFLAPRSLSMSGWQRAAPPSAHRKRARSAATSSHHLETAPA